MANPPSDPGIPLLTEVIGPQSPDAAATPASLPQASLSLPAANPPAAKIPQPPRPAMPPAETSTGQSGATAIPRVGVPLSGSSPGPISGPGSNPSQAALAPNPGINARTAPVTPAMSQPVQTTATRAEAVAPASPAASAPIRTQESVDPEIEAPLAPSSGAWSDSELRDLENELRLRITKQVLGRIDFVLDHRVRNSVTEVVDAAIDALALEIKRGLHETLTDMVARAVAQEVSRLQSGKK
ncbi:hypothetical protein [Paucimonas lemoignei]|uniref:hypothetical protein n=1 Tax=Paucimonas lemoignei TaxID=29443 RepID=UPI0010497015|nr:hypothetical protein [Paucimonas lemoignei]